MDVLSFSHQGQRNYQEDGYYMHKNRNLFIVCDGVGGSANGAKASQSVIETVVSEFQKYDEVLDPNRICKMIESAWKNLKEISEGLGIATTVALLYFDGNSAYTAHLGDSKIFHLKPKSNSLWFTKDHSMVQELFDAGVLESEKQMKVHPMKNRITKAVSSASEMEKPEIHKIETIEQEDIFLLCSDGVLENIENKQLLEIFKNDSLENSWNYLKEDCLKKSMDNNTCILIKL